MAMSMDILAERASLVRDSLDKSQSITHNMVSILGSFDHRLSALETAMRPTQASLSHHFCFREQCDYIFHIRTHSVRRAHENINRTLKQAETVLDRYTITRQAEAKILRGPHEDLENYLQSIDQLKANAQFFSDKKYFKRNSAPLNHVNGLLSKAVMKLEVEFTNLLALNSKPVDPDHLYQSLPKSLRPSSHKDANNKSSNNPTDKESESNEYKSLTLMPPHVLPWLHDLADQMVQAGYQQQVLMAYRETRAAVLDISFAKLGLEKLSKEEVQRMQWEMLEAKIGNWVFYMRIAVKLLFPGERRVADQIFKGIDSIRMLCFAEVTSSSVSTLLSFGDAIARGKRSPEKLFVLLDMYEIMRELLPEFLSTFEGKPCIEMREAAASLRLRLAQTAQETFSDFEEAVEKDATKTIVHDGTVHPLTSYVINYVKFLFDYQSTLNLLFRECGGPDANSELAFVTTRIVQALQTNLDGKSKLYRDPALSQLFLMNNIHYMVRSVSRSDAKDMVGSDWVQRQRRVVQQHANQYRRLSWSKILQYLTVQSSGHGDSGGNLSRATVKDRFKNFNIQFEDIHHRQCQWSVPDSELRESLRLAVAEVLLPAYRSFAKRFGPGIESGKNPQKYIRYRAEDLEHMLSEFFEGRTFAEQKR
ncbi:hypothetical protein V2J09_018649 [Rumex salicifolius]